ncbi:MAG: ABC-type bacteriocin/lantibiotic exporter with double-glycine peptidase domain, partial [Ulvibacter sp.]
EIIILLIISSVEKLIRGLETFYDVLTSLEKIGQVVDKDLEKQTGIDPFKNNPDLHLELDGIQYTTPEGGKILRDINLSIKQKDRIIFEGSSGSGKTTLLKLLSGLVSPSGGSLYINDTSIKGVMLNEYRAYVGQVLPEQSTFEGTILENITFGNDNVSNEQLNTTLKNVGLLSFIKNQPNGINTMLYPEGHRLSFTVTKRIVLARAIIHNPKLLLLKDPLEHFEEDEAEEIISYLTAPERPWALIVSTRGKQWQKHCTQTIVISDGIIKSKKINNA